MLEMRTQCERCHTALKQDDLAYICSYECTWCHDCTENMNHICPNCGGELTRRPKRLKKE